jgi:hypothetical protein
MEAAEVREQVGLAYELQEALKEHEFTQVLLLAFISLAHQHLKEWNQAEKAITDSLNLLQTKRNINSSNEGLQIQVLIHRIKGKFLASKEDNKAAIEAYKKAFYILTTYENETKKNINDKIQIISDDNSRYLHKEFLNLLTINNKEKKLLYDVEASLKRHYYAELNNLLKNKKWKSADIITWQLMLYIAKRERENNLDIESIQNFSCPELQEIDKLWQKYSNGRFGFSLQKRIYSNTGNKSGNLDAEAYKRFVELVGWYDPNESQWRPYEKVMEVVEKDYTQAPVGTLPLPPKKDIYNYIDDAGIFLHCDFER